MPNFKPKKTKNNARSFTNWLDLCKSCGLCIHVCPVKCLSWDEDKLNSHGLSSVKININKCVDCKQCERICPDAAIQVEKNYEPLSLAKKYKIDINKFKKENPIQKNINLAHQ